MVPTLALVSALIALTAVALVRWPAFGYWGAWFFITLAPASSLIPIPTEVGAERRMYLPLIAIVVVSVLFATLLLRRVVRPPLSTWLGWALSTAAVFAVGIGTVVRNRDYQSGLAIWQTVLDVSPHPRAHEHLSMYLRDAGRIDDSIAHLRIAAPASPNARHALASALLERGDVESAGAEFREFIRSRPEDPHIIEAREEFAIALIRTGDVKGAEEQFRAIVARNPAYTRGHIGLGDALLRLSQPEDARREFEAAVRLQPDNVVALVNLGLLQVRAGETDAAVATLRHATAVEPRQLIARRQVADIYLRRGQYKELEAEARALLRYTPDDASVHNVLGIALASQQRYDLAKQAFADAVRLDPGNVQARQNLERLR